MSVCAAKLVQRKVRADEGCWDDAIPRPVAETTPVLKKSEGHSRDTFGRVANPELKIEVSLGWEADR